MARPSSDAKTLLGHRVAVTGRLASMTRKQAAALVRAHGGRWAPSVTRETSMLVVGQDGWPLDQDGRLTRKLQKARFLQRIRPLAILTEADLLSRLGLERPANGLRRLSTSQLSETLRVSGERIRNWVRWGLIQPVQTVNGVHYFEFQQARWAKTLCDFAASGVSPERIRRSLEHLKKWLPNVEQPLAQLAVLERDGRLVVRLPEGQLAEPTGQGLFEFTDEPTPDAPSVTFNRWTAEQWLQFGFEQEEEGLLTDAARAYRQAVLLGAPNAEACFNLGNVLYALGEKQPAVEHFRQAVRIDPGFVEAWSNLGTALSDLGQQKEAIAALERALHLHPLYADAHYNLGDILDQLGREREALPHWQAYVRSDPTSRWGKYARQRLDKANRPKQA
jgi:tetratricopeptide (TPR) repeat protein